MNSQTKIIVINSKALIIGAIVAIALIVAVIFFVTTSKDGDNQNPAINTSGKVTTNVTSDNVVRTYNPGVYTASISLNGNPVDIQVTVDKENINSITMVNLSESVTTMYPLLQTNFDTIANAVMTCGTTANIEYSAESKYTSTMLLSAIQSALDKATVTDK